MLSAGSTQAESVHLERRYRKSWRAARVPNPINDPKSVVSGTASFVPQTGVFSVLVGKSRSMDFGTPLH